MDIDFMLDGISAKSRGIILQKPIEISALSPSLTSVKIAGRSGNIHIFDDTYESRTAVATCYCLGKDVSTVMSNVCEFLFGTFGERKLSTMDGYFYKAVITNAAELHARLNMINPFTITFDCYPFRYLESGQSPQTIENGGVITNPTSLVSYPTISIDVQGEGTLTVNYDVFKINGLGYSTTVVINSDKMNVSDTSGDLNTLVSWSKFPQLSPGDNAISWSGDINVLSIAPNWRSF